MEGSEQILTVGAMQQIRLKQASTAGMNWTAVALYEAETTFEVTKLSPGKQERHRQSRNPDGTSSGALVLNGSLLGDPIPGVEEVLLSKSLKPWASNRVEMELEWNSPSHSPSWPGKDEADAAQAHCGGRAVIPHSFSVFLLNTRCAAELLSQSKP